jgi:TetR/AcrR family transcriptional regulator
MISSTKLGVEDAPAPNGHAAVGRPRKRDGADKDVHDALLVAANECLVREATTRVPVRHIAAKAGVNQAMVNYYFSSKSGLFLALFESQFSRLIRDLKSFLKEVSRIDGSEAPNRNYIEDLICIIESNFSTSPALFVLLHSDMLDEQSETRKAYKDRFGARGYTIIVRIMRMLMRRGICRDDISPDHAAYFICSTSAMPFLVAPIFERAFDSKIDGQIAEQRRRAAAQLLAAHQPA